MKKRQTAIYVSKPRALLFAIEAAIIVAWLGIVALFMKAGIGEYLAVVVLLGISLFLLIGSDLLTAFLKVSGLSTPQTSQPDHSRPEEAGFERMDAPSKTEPLLLKPTPKP